MIHLRTLGSLDLRGPDGHEIRSVLTQPKRFTLLVYLALAAPRGFHRRDKLVALFWPDLDTSHARNALSQALHVLRRGVGDGVLFNRGDEVGLVEEGLFCDAVAFESAYAERRWADALELYRGDLLEGCFVGGAASDLDGWMDEQRARLRRMAVAAALAAAAEQEAAGNLPLALHWAQRSIGLAPHDEAALRCKLTILGRQDDRAGMLLAYEIFERRLREELDLEPSAELQARLREIRAPERERPDVTTPHPVRTDLGLPEGIGGETGPSLPAHSRATRSMPGRSVVLAGSVTALILMGGLLVMLPNRSTRAHSATALSAIVSVGDDVPDTRVARSIAVLPFVDMSLEKDQEFFSDGLTVELLNALAQVPGLHVAAPTSSFAFKGRSVPVDEIAQRLRVVHVLEGSVRKTGSRLRITVQLVRADSGYHLWSETYERELNDIFAVQEDISRRVVTALKGELAGGEGAGPAQRPTRDVVAYEHYLKGRHSWNQRTGLALESAIGHFEAAIARDSRYAHPHAGLADAYNLLGAMGYARGTEIYPKARAAAHRALAIDSTLAAAHAALGFVLVVLDADYLTSEREFQRAIALNPNYASAHQWYGQMMVFRSGERFEESRRSMERARALDPLSLAVQTDWARDAYLARQYDLAVERLQGPLAIDPKYARSHGQLAMVYIQQGRFDAAIAEFQMAIDLAGGWWPSRFGQAGLGRAYALSGRTSEARRVLEELKRSERYVSPEALALIHVALGEHDAALDALEQAWFERSINTSWLAFDPAWDSLRTDRRFVRLLRRMSLNTRVPPPASWVVE
jgi:adenylate cyclase